MFNTSWDWPHDTSAMLGVSVTRLRACFHLLVFHFSINYVATRKLKLPAI